MSRERDLLARVLTSELWSVQEELQAEIKQLLAQPEQEPVAWMQDSIELYVLEEKSAIRGYVIPLYLAPPKREPLSEDAADECLANAIKNGWYPVNEDSYRQGFWDAIKLLEVGNE